MESQAKETRLPVLTAYLVEYECLREEKFGSLWPDALNQREDLIAEFLGIFQSFHGISRYGTFAFI